MGLLSDLMKARLFGHPIHAMLIHFPSALWPASFLFDLMAFMLNEQALAQAAFYTLAFGLISAIAAAIFGAIDFYHLSSEHKAWKKASYHAYFNIFWLCLFTVLLGIQLSHYPHIEVVPLGYLIIEFFGVCGLIYSNYLGGELVFRHKIGIADDVQ